jgi:RHS repeat-associated protein
VQKTAGGVTTQFVYDSSGRLLEEANASGVAQKEYIWLDDTPVAIVDDTGTSPVLYFIQTDQLGTPQKITDGSMNIIWDGAFDPFGNPVTGGMGSATWGSAQWGGFSWGATGPNLSLTNLRFPGQYFDSETALNQNWNRDYDATVGRYLESDPLGFDGGTYLTYEYAGGNPINNDDPLGLFLFSVHQEITRAAMDQAGGADCPDLPWQVSQVDFLPGSQDTQNAYWHAMRNGRDPTNTVSAARKAFGKYVDVESRSCTCEGLARALHAVQDSHAAGHSGFQPWNGGIPSASHIWQDATPVSREWDGAVQDSAKLIRKYQKECKKDCVPH